MGWLIDELSHASIPFVTRDAHLTPADRAAGMQRGEGRHKRRAKGDDERNTADQTSGHDRKHREQRGRLETCVPSRGARGVRSSPRCFVRPYSSRDSKRIFPASPPPSPHRQTPRRIFPPRPASRLSPRVRVLLSRSRLGALPRSGAASRLLACVAFGPPSWRGWSLLVGYFRGFALTRLSSAPRTLLSAAPASLPPALRPAALVRRSEGAPPGRGDRSALQRLDRTSGPGRR